MSCCSRKTSASANRPLARVPDNEIKSFEALVESLQVDLIGTEELKTKKKAVFSKPEWITPGRNRMENLLKECQGFANLLSDQIDVMSRALKAEVIINTRLEDALTREVKSTRKITVVNK